MSEWVSNGFRMVFDWSFQLFVIGSFWLDATNLNSAFRGILEWGSEEIVHDWRLAHVGLTGRKETEQLSRRRAWWGTGRMGSWRVNVTGTAVPCV